MFSLTLTTLPILFLINLTSVPTPKCSQMAAFVHAAAQTALGRHCANVQSHRFNKTWSALWHCPFYSYLWWGLVVAATGVARGKPDLVLVLVVPITIYICKLSLRQVAGDQVFNLHPDDQERLANMFMIPLAVGLVASGATLIDCCKSR